MFMFGVILAPAFVRAEWTGGAANSMYLDPNNWSGGAIDDVFSGTAISSNPAITMAGDRASSGLSVIYATSSTLTLQASEGPRTFSVSGGRILVDIGGTAYEQTFTVGAQNADAKRVNFDFGGEEAVVEISPESSTKADTFKHYGSISGSGFRRVGNGTLHLYGAVSCPGGAAEFLGGVSYLYGWGASGSHGIDARSIVVDGNGTRVSVQSAMSGKDIVLAGGVFQSNADIAGGALSLRNGRCGLVQRGSKTMQFSSLTRAQDAILMVAAGSTDALGGTAKVGAGLDLSGELVGGIIPWAGVRAFSGDEDFAKFDTSNYCEVQLPAAWTSENGFAAVAESDLALPGDATDGSNVRIAESYTLASDATWNSITFTGGEKTLDLGGHVLNLTSGLVITRNNKPTIRNGTLRVGNRALIVVGRQQLTLSANLDSGVVDASAPIVICTGGISFGGNLGTTGTIFMHSGSLTGAGVTAQHSVELGVSSSNFPYDWAGGTSKAGLVGGIGSIQAGNADKTLVVGSGEKTSSAKFAVVSGGVVAPGRIDLQSGRRRGTLSVGSNFASMAFEAGSKLKIDVRSEDEATSLNAANSTVQLGGSLELAGAFDSVKGGSSWTIVTAKADASADTITGSFASVPPGFKVNLFSTAGYATVNAARLTKKPSGFCILVR